MREIFTTTPTLCQTTHVLFFYDCGCCRWNRFGAHLLTFITLTFWAVFVCVFDPMRVQGGPSVNTGTNFSGNGRSGGGGSDHLFRDMPRTCKHKRSYFHNKI